MVDKCVSVNSPFSWQQHQLLSGHLPFPSFWGLDKAPPRHGWSKRHSDWLRNNTGSSRIQSEWSLGFISRMIHSCLLGLICGLGAQEGAAVSVLWSENEADKQKVELGDGRKSNLHDIMYSVEVPKVRSTPEHLGYINKRKGGPFLLKWFWVALSATYNPKNSGWYNDKARTRFPVSQCLPFFP